MIIRLSVQASCHTLSEAHLMRQALLIILFVLGAELSITTPALGQDALGAGNALDANLNRRTGRSNLSRDRLDFLIGNLIVTDNVARGLGFRGTVGYTAPRDFRGRLAEDSQFRFRADSALSNQGLMRNYSDYKNLRYGQNLGLLSYYRTNSDNQTRESADYRFRVSNLSNFQREHEKDTLLQSASTRQTRVNAPSLIGLTYTPEGKQILIGASSLRGISSSQSETDDYERNLSPFDRARLAQDQLVRTPPSRLTFSSKTSMANLRLDDGRQEIKAADNRQSNIIQEEAYLSLLNRIADRYAGDDPSDMTIQRELLTGLGGQYEALRQRLEQSLQRSDQEPGKPVERLRPTETPSKPDTEGDEEKELALRGIKQYGLILRHGERVQHFASDREDRFNELMRTAEERLANREYFWSERRFQRALRIIPDHPFALAGVAHAQLGAGLYLPSAFTLRRLLIKHPEMIDVHYAKTLLPDQNRMFKAVSELQLRLKEKIEVDSHGFLLAYIGHQLDNQKLIEEGLTQMASIPHDPTFIELLQSIWTEED